MRRRLPAAILLAAGAMFFVAAALRPQARAVNITLGACFLVIGLARARGRRT